MSIRKRLAGLLRQVDLEPTVPLYEDAISRLEGFTYRLANRLDPREPFDGWQDLGYVSDADDFFGMVFAEQRKATEAAFQRYVDQFVSVTAVPNFVIELTEKERPFIAKVHERTEQYATAWEKALRLADPNAAIQWSDPVRPTAADIEEVKEVVRKAYENGQPVEPDYMAKLGPVFGPFEHTDLAPHLKVIDSMVRDVIRQYADLKEADLEAWVDDLGKVVPGFDASTARQIIADRFLP